MHLSPIAVSSDSIIATVRAPVGAQVHLMLTCLCDAFYPEVGLAAVRVLEHRGYHVVFDEGQTCCGQPAFNSGDWTAARRVAAHTLRVFRGAGIVITPSASCAAMIRWGYPQLFTEAGERKDAENLASRTYELTEFLVRHDGVESWPGVYRKRVAFHRSCHFRGIHAGDAPERLLKSIEGLHLAAMRTPEQCCGFGGTFAVTFPWVSSDMGGAKLAALSACGAEEITAADMGCLTHLRGLASRQAAAGVSASPPMRHIAEILADSLAEQRRCSSKPL